MATRSLVAMVADQTYYGLPADFSGARDVEFVDIGGANRETLSLVTPEQMTQRAASTLVTGVQPVYTIVANQIQIYPPQDGRVMEIVYYQNLPNLTVLDAENWLSAYAPDAYVFGLLVEINAFVKDATSAQLWDGRFKEVMNELDADDQRGRWSGPSLKVRVT